MGTIKEAATEFLSERRIAVTGVGSPRDTGPTSCTSASGTAGPIFVEPVMAEIREGGDNR